MDESDYLSSMPSVRELLDSHERELLKRLDVLRAQMKPIEAELDDVRRARAAIGGGEPAAATEGSGALRYARMTNKELALTALRGFFPEGATAAELLQYFKEKWNRDIDLSSFSPQLSRLAQAGTLEKTGKVWRLKMAERVSDTVDGTRKNAAPKKNAAPHEVPQAGDQTDAV